MGMIDPPKKWAYLVAIGPASIAAGVLLVIAILAGAPSMELALLWMLSSFASVPAVIVGTWMDAEVVEAETGVPQKQWVWALLAVFFAPLIGIIYLWSRRKYFDEAPAAAA